MKKILACGVSLLLMGSLYSFNVNEDSFNKSEIISKLKAKTQQNNSEEGFLKENMNSMIEEFLFVEPDSSLEFQESVKKLSSDVENDCFSGKEVFLEEFYRVYAQKISFDVEKQDERNFASEITNLSKSIHSMDEDKLDVEMNEMAKGQNLFVKYSGNIPESYKKTIELCNKFYPKNQTNDHKKLDSDIDEYLEYISKYSAIKYALKVTNTTIKDLKANWFGSGLGFEHVFAGEIKGSSVGGYHFWYRFYDNEQDGSAVYKYTIEGADDNNIFTGSFTWDADGKGKQFRPANKRKGGFSTKSSAPAILALGHIAMEVAKQNNAPSAFRFMADINGSLYNWQVFASGRSIRSLYPMVLKGYKIDDKILEAREVLLDEFMK